MTMVSASTYTLAFTGFEKAQEEKDCFALPLHIATMVGSLGVRKGAWTEEEDNLLRKSIAIYGEGKWHQVPLRAGLNRCRKSCRLRWLNYLKPNIKRGEFAADEVDLMVRLHKLLGNRWSLIASRLPGRTSNDVKNYWNTHKKVVSNDKKEVSPETSEIVKPFAIRPRPLIFSRNSPWLREKITLREDVPIKDNMNKPSPAQILVPENDNNWWESILEDLEENGGNTSSTRELNGDKPIANQFWVDETPPPIETSDHTVHIGRNNWSDFSFEADDIWNILSAI